MSSVPQSSPQAERDAELDAFIVHLIQGEITADRALARLRSEIVALRPLPPPSPAAARLLAALAATRPEAVTPDIAVAFAPVIEQADLTRTWQPGLDAVFELLPLLVPTPAAAALPELIATILDVDNLHDRWARRTATLLEELHRRRPELIDARGLLALAGAAPESVRGGLFERVVCSAILADPARLDTDLLGRATALLDGPLKARYLAAAIAAHPNAPAEVRTAATTAIEQAFPLRRAWRRLTGDRALRVLCIQNIADGQSHEIIRVVPLLQALLDGHEETTITLITDRGYLYGHPRLETIGFDDRAQIERQIASAPEVFIEFSERVVRHLNYDTDLIDAAARLRESARPLLDIQAGKGWDNFTFDQVRLGGQAWAAALALNQRTGNGVYAPVFRLMAELGLPMRLGQMTPARGCILRDGNGVDGDDARDALMTANRWMLAGDAGRGQPVLAGPPGKRAWLALLEGTADPVFYDLLADACRSEDADVRLAATRALGRLRQPNTVADLMVLLDDRSRSVRGAAADGLLSHHRDALGAEGNPDIRTLEAYRLIAETPPKWQQLASNAGHSRPALEAALWGDEPVIRREAAVVLELINRETRSQTHALRQ